MAEFTMPSLGADMDQGTLQEWLVHAGDPVRKGDPVAVVETAKSTIEVECFETGTIGQLLVTPGTTVPVGTPLARIEPTAEAGTPTKPEAPAKPARSPRPPAAEGARSTARKPPRRKPTPPLAPAATAPPADHAIKHRGHDDEGPLVRHLAERAGVDLDTVHGTGRGGRVTRTDVGRAAAAARSPARVTPYARRLARELGVDLRGLTGTGPDGTLRASDVRAAAPGPTLRPLRSPAPGCRPAPRRFGGRRGCGRPSLA
ncbi:E3 binding domain-containing protein [Streptomyces noursei]|uniref:E3 binding domain-containing protein n=1 Tax=Streptomyces noursei TaxID=1971 RepID=UPI00378734A8